MEENLTPFTTIIAQVDLEPYKFTWNIKYKTVVLYLRVGTNQTVGHQIRKER